MKPSKKAIGTSTGKAAAKHTHNRQTKKKALCNEWRRIDYYFELLDEHGPAEDLWKMLKLALISGDEHADKRDRSNMIFFYECSRELFKNVYSLLQQQKKKMGLME